MNIEHKGIVTKVKCPWVFCKMKNMKNMKEPVKKYVRNSISHDPHCDTHIICIVVKLLQMKKQILNTKHIVVYPLGGDARNLCAGVHYNTLQKNL